MVWLIFSRVFGAAGLLFILWFLLEVQMNVMDPLEKLFP
jgi:hypothetical protein